MTKIFALAAAIGVLSLSGLLLADGHYYPVATAWLVIGVAGAFISKMTETML